MAAAAGIPAEFRDGLRVTDADTMDVVEMVLVGRVNKQIVNGLNQLGTRAVGLSGSDGSLVEARPWGNGSHGLVGDVARVNPDVLEPLLEKGYVPVISSVAATPDDGRPTTSMPTQWRENWQQPWRPKN